MRACGATSSCWLPHLTDAAPIVLDDSTDPALGPVRLVAEAGLYRLKVTRTVGKVTDLRRAGANA